MMQVLRLSCRSEVLGLEHGGLDPVTNQLQRAYFEMALAFFSASLRYWLKSLAPLFQLIRSQTRTVHDLHDRMRLLQDVIGSRGYELAL